MVLLTASRLLTTNGYLILWDLLIGTVAGLAEDAGAAVVSGKGKLVGG